MSNSDSPSSSSWTRHQKLRNWVEEMATLTQPDEIYYCDGSDKEFSNLASKMVEEEKLISLNPQKRPGSFACNSHPDDVARVEESTFICSEKKEDAGPTNNWREPQEMKKELLALFSGSMRGRTMYVIPFCMGPLSSDKSYVGVEITDSPYVVLNMKIMTRMGTPALQEMEKREFFVPCMHSVGVPLEPGEKDVPWPCNPQNRRIVHFPETKEIWSFGSGYGGNALLGKKCFALRIASVLAKEEGWLAEHMLIMGITNPKGEKKYFAASFPSACGKTNLAMLSPSLPGWKIECVGDDIAWMKKGKDGRLWAINPEAGMFGVAPGTSNETNPNAIKTIEKNTIFTNVALTDDKDVWWEGLSDPPSHLTDWKNQSWIPSSKEKASHPNARFTAPLTQCPIVDPAFDSPEGVPISAIIFGGRRSDTLPLVMESFDWEHGTFLGASVSSAKTAAAKGKVGELRHDPFAMLPFCGYNMGDYFAHWLEIGKDLTEEKRPKIFHVNWFQKENDKYLWPGFGENIRVLSWIFARVEEKKEAIKTPIGLLPKLEDLDLSNLDLPKEEVEKLFKIDTSLWKKEVEGLKKYFALFKGHFPKKLQKQLELLEKRIYESASSKG